MEIAASLPLELTEEEIVRMTGYKRPGKQIEAFTALGIPTYRRPDNTVLILRVHCIYPVGSPESETTSRPKLKPISRKK